MKTVQAVKYFGSEAKLAKALNINRSAVHRWGEVVPIKRAWTIERLSKGKVAFGIRDYR